MPLYLKDKLVSGTGAPGKSAYEAAKAGGYTGTEASFNQALKDIPGHIADTENPHGVTAAQVGTYSKSEADTLLAGKAPAGYGLGTGAVTPPNNNLDNAVRNGWYVCSPSFNGAPTGHDYIGYGTVLTIERASDCCIQVYWSEASSNIVGSPLNLVRKYDGTTWYPWEWVNPPFIRDVVYRTTERYHGNPVYKKMDSNGIIWWSTDQSTWKVEATRVGAMKSILTGGFLDGIPNLNETNHRITGPGWFRILRTTGNDSFLIRLGHGYNSGGPEDMLFHVCIDRYCPSIVILSNSVYSQYKYKFYTKIRITYDDTYSYVDFYYDRNLPNSVQSNIWWFNKNRAGCMTEPLLLSQVDDSPSGETISLIQDVSIIDSGNVLTVGADNILPLNKGGTGANNIRTARANLGIDKIVSCPAGGSITLTLPSNCIYLIGTSDNVRQNGLILVHTDSSNAQNNVLRVTQLASPNSWAYSLSGGVLALSETDGRYAAAFSVVTLCSQDGVVY